MWLTSNGSIAESLAYPYRYPYRYRRVDAHLGSYQLTQSTSIKANESILEDKLGESRQNS